MSNKLPEDGNNKKKSTKPLSKFFNLRDYNRYRRRASPGSSSRSSDSSVLSSFSYDIGLAIEENSVEPEDSVTMRCAPTVRRMPTVSSEPSPAVRSYLEMAFDYLQDDSVGIIGIYGMGGVGKTFLLQRINNHPFVAAAGFDYVIWLVASQDLNLNQLQKDMAERLGLPLRDDATIEERGQSLYSSLKRKKFLLLLDDIWGRVDLEKLGITFPTSCSSSSSNGAPVPKVVFTTRSEGVCDQMMAGLKLCGRKIKVECMQQEVACPR